MTKLQACWAWLRGEWTMRPLIDGKRPVPVEDILEWAAWHEKADRNVAKTKVGKVSVSTVFLGVDHSFTREGPPILFETMIFGGPHDQYQERYATWDEAEAGHKAAVDLVKRRWKKMTAT